MARSAGAPARETFSIKCGRCSLIFATDDCRKLEHFSIYRVVCPHCAWPGRYLASELHALVAAKAGGPTPRKDPAKAKVPHKGPQIVGES
jgi:hypothetical protein